MASYSEKYYFSFTSGGVSQRLSIAEKNYSGGATSLTDLLQSIRLTRQGDELLESPIVKSALTINLVDRDGGMWEEFFTPDSTKYKVTLSAGGTMRWCGFITPDSYEEDLTYRGSISITARDMVGHMADIPFDSTNIMTDGDLASVYDIIEEGLRLAECPMQLDFRAEGEREYIKSGNYSCDGWLVDLRSCEDKNFYEIAESLLDSLGLVMRWEETGYIVVTSIRDLPCGGNSYDADNVEHDIQFWDVSGHRTLEPAYRMIDEVLQYDVFEGETSEWGTDAFNGDRLTGNNGWTQALQGKKVMTHYIPEVFPPEYSDVSAEDGDKYVMLYAVSAYNTGTQTTAKKTYTMPKQTNCVFSFDIAKLYYEPNMLTITARGKLPQGTLDYAIRWRKTDNTYLYLKQEDEALVWSDDSSDAALRIVVEAGAAPFHQYGNKSKVEVSHSFTTPNEDGDLEIVFSSFYHTCKTLGGENETDPFWVRLGNVTLSIEQSGMPKDMKIKTYYDEAQNYTLKRTPKYGKCPAKVTSAGVILNGFYLPSSGHPSVQSASIGSGSSLPLPVVVDMEILSRHLQTTSLLSGTIAPSGGEMARMSARWYRGERMFILQGGSLDPVRNCIEGATLREFTTGNSWTTDNYEIK